MKKTAYEKHGALRVQERNLVDLNGNIVFLRGVSSHGLSWYPEYINQDSIAFMKEAWDIDVIRLAMYTAEEDGYCVSDDANREKLKKVVEQGVMAAKELGLYVIIDWHILSDSNPLMNLDQSLAFFEEVANKYGDQDHVIFEICNEPNVGASWEDIQDYARKVIPVIRKYSPENVILVGTPTWSQDVDLAVNSPLSEYDNIMYVLHFYADTHRDDLRKKLEDAHDSGLPIFVSEFGICDASGNGSINVEQADLWIELLTKRNISYVIWNLSNRDESSAFFLPNCHKLLDFTKEDLNDSAIWFIDKMGRADAL